jgi:hypothetical protein
MGVDGASLSKVTPARSILAAAPSPGSSQDSFQPHSWLEAAGSHARELLIQDLIEKWLLMILGLLSNQVAKLHGSSSGLQRPLL